MLRYIIFSVLYVEVPWLVLLLNAFYIVLCWFVLFFWFYFWLYIKGRWVRPYETSLTPTQTYACACPQSGDTGHYYVFVSLFDFLVLILNNYHRFVTMYFITFCCRYFSELTKRCVTLIEDLLVISLRINHTIVHADLLRFTVFC